jgi:D-glycero-beta-D-manno-heptose 1-phosphate adenylyltransferase
MKNKKIVFTNGCFDIIHRGHIDYLEEAKKLGDILLIGLNSDESVRKLKGENRPINNEEDRKKVLLALKSVDEVIIFNEEDPLELVKQIKPDVIVKGGDWKIENMIGADFVIENGGEAYSLPFYDGYSTTNILNKMKD